MKLSVLPVVCTVKVAQLGDQFSLRPAEPAGPAPLLPEHRVVVQRVVHDGMSCKINKLITGTSEFKSISNVWL